MVATSTFLYENKPDSTFDLDYYLTKHMPLVADQFKDAGLLDYRVVQYNKAAGPEASPYQIGCVLTWKSAEDAQKALQSEGLQTVLADVKNYTDVKPVHLLGEGVGDWENK